jgi:hypothetical protein
MATIKVKDWELNVKIKAEFVRHWIDVQEINISAARGVVYVRGKLAFKGGKVDTTSELSISKQLKSVERSVRSVPGVVDIKFDFAEWEKVGGSWHPRRGKKVDGKE